MAKEQASINQKESYTSECSSYFSFLEYFSESPGSIKSHVCFSFISFFFQFFVVWNSTFGGKDIFGCSFRNCGLSDCWDEHSSAALLVWVPTIIPLPSTKKAKQTEMTLYREKRDSGEIAAVIAVIAVSAAAAMVAGLTMAQT